MVYDPAFARRRQRRLRNPNAPIYDEGLIGGRTIDVEEDPFDGDNERRKEAYASMGQFLKADLNRARSRGEYFVETRPSQSSQPGQPLASHMPRPSSVTPTTAKYSNIQHEPEYDLDDGYDDDDQDDDQYEDELEDEQYYGSTVSDEPEYDQSEYYEDYIPQRNPRERERSESYDLRRPASRDNRPHPASPERYQQDRPRGRQLPPGRSAGYPRQQPQRLPQPERRNAPPSPQQPPRRQRRRTSDVPPTSRPAPQPTQPALLAPDGSIPRNPCGDFLVVRIGKMRVSIECQEERRNPDAPFHQGMPHIAKINDGGANGNAFFVWDHERPRVPDQSDQYER